MNSSPRFLAAMALVALAAALGAFNPRSPDPISSEWYGKATADPRSPISAGAQALTESWIAPDGRTISVGVGLPRASFAGTIVEVSPSADDGATILRAADRLRGAGGGVLSMAPGRYRLNVDEKRPGLILRDLTDVTIDGPGAVIDLNGSGQGIVIRSSNRLAVRGISIGYTNPAVFAGTIRRSGAVAELTLDDKLKPPPDNASVYQVSILHGEQGLYGGGLTRHIFRRDPLTLKLIRAGQYKVDHLPDDIPDGARVAVKLSSYAGAALAVSDNPDQPRSNDISFIGVSIRNAPGMGIQIGRMGRGLAVIKSHFGEAGAPSATIAYDGLHVSGMAGDILVRDNDFTRTGDDAINLASPIIPAVSGQSDAFAVRSREGDLSAGTLAALFDADLGYIGLGKISSRGPADAAGERSVTFSSAIPRAGDVRYIRDLGLSGNRFAVVNNRIGECECHAILAQGPNGLVRANRISNTGFNAIKLVTSAFWKEGAGVQNVLVEDNVIDGTGVDWRRGLLAAAIMVYAEGAGTPPGMLSTPVHSGLVIRKNEVDHAAQACISISSATHVVLAQNHCGSHDLESQKIRNIIGADFSETATKFPGKIGYLLRGNGMWIDPVTTRDVTVSSER